MGHFASLCSHFAFHTRGGILAKRLRPAIHLSQNEKNRKCIAMYFASLFSHFVPLFLLFAFCSLCARVGIRAKSQIDFVVYFFVALIKHKILMKYEKYIVSVSYFVVCFTKTFAKYPQNAKYEKCIAGRRIS